MRKSLFQILPLILTTFFLFILAFILASRYSVNLSSFDKWYNRIIYFPLLFLLCFIVTGLIESYFSLSNFTDKTSGQVKIRELWQATLFKINPFSGILVSSLMGLGIIGCANLTEIYRSVTVVWHDSVLWEIEKPLFINLINSWINVPWIWDHI